MLVRSINESVSPNNILVSILSISTGKIQLEFLVIYSCVSCNSSGQWSNTDYDRIRCISD